MEKKQNKHKKEAQKCLNYLREGTDSYDYFLDCLRREVENGGFSLADIGTSEEELEELRVKSCKISAQRWLKDLREGTELYSSYHRFLLKRVKAGGFSLADIGTSEEELEELRVKSHKDCAQRFLNGLREGTEFYNSYLYFLQEEVEDGGFSFADIGTSEEELKELWIKKGYYKAAA